MATPDKPSAVLLLSGGLDSVTLLALAAQAGRSVHALSFRYGQRHAAELDCAARQAQRFGAAAHEVVNLSHMGRLVASATALVADSALPVPDHDRVGEGIPSTYVPARNTLFLSYALAWAEALDAAEIWIGVNCVDYSGYPDCRPAFIESFERTANLGTRAGVDAMAAATPALRIRTPLIGLTKAEIIGQGVAAGVDYADTISCYNPQMGPDGPLACGRCDSCHLRRDGFRAAGVADPTRYSP